MNSFQKLTLPDKDILTFLEKPRVRQRGTASPHEVGEALLAIRDKQLHREVSPNFYDYCLIRFGMLPQSVDRYIAIASGFPAEQKTEKRKSVSKMVVYFVRAGELIKIGYTSNLEKRIASLSNMSPIPIELIGSLLGDKHVEKEVHNRFAHLRHHGEWFRADKKLLQYIKELAQ